MWVLGNLPPASTFAVFRGPCHAPGERLLANELGVGCTLASRLRIEGDEPVETVEEIRHVHRGPPKQRQFVRVSLIGVTTPPTAGVDVKQSLPIEVGDAVRR